jgi:hypothetical protein
VNRGRLAAQDGGCFEPPGGHVEEIDLRPAVAFLCNKLGAVARLNNWQNF